MSVLPRGTGYGKQPDPVVVGTAHSRHVKLIGEFGPPGHRLHPLSARALSPDLSPLRGNNRQAAQAPKSKERLTMAAPPRAGGFVTLIKHWKRSLNYDHHWNKRGGSYDGTKEQGR